MKWDLVQSMALTYITMDGSDERPEVSNQQRLDAWILYSASDIDYWLLTTAPNVRCHDY